MSPSLRRIVTVLASLVPLLPGNLAGLQRPGQTYESPLHNFSVVVPEMSFATKVQKENNKDDGMVTFLGDGGDVERIDYQRLPPDFPYPTDSVKLRAFGHVVLDDLLAANAGTILDEGPIQIAGQDGWFALVKLLHASRASDAAGHRLDSTRALLVFARSGFLYTLHSDLGAMGGTPSADGGRRMVNVLYGRITFH